MRIFSPRAHPRQEKGSAQALSKTAQAIKAFFQSLPLKLRKYSDTILQARWLGIHLPANGLEITTTRSSLTELCCLRNKNTCKSHQNLLGPNKGIKEARGRQEVYGMTSPRIKTMDSLVKVVVLSRKRIKKQYTATKNVRMTILQMFLEPTVR